MAPNTSMKLKLTPEGSRLLQDFLRENGENYSTAGEALGVPTSTGRLAVLGKGWMTPEQVARLTAWTYGEITPAQLVGAAEARRLRVPKLVPRKRDLPPAVPAPALGAQSGGDAGDVEALAGAEVTRNVQALIKLRDDPRSTPGQRARAIETLLEYGVGKPRQRERQDVEAPPERDEDLILELKQLVAGARRRLERLAGGDRT